MKNDSRQAVIIRSVLFALLGAVFLVGALPLEPGVSRKLFLSFGFLDLAWAGWIASSLWRGRS